MPLLERHQNDSVIDADRRAISEGKIVRPRRQSDIVDNQITVLLGDDFANFVFNGLKNPLGRLNPSAGGCAHVQLNLPAINGRKEIASDQRQQGAAESEDQDGRDRNEDPPMQ
jgi:hypothetical protein